MGMYFFTRLLVFSLFPSFLSCYSCVASFFKHFCFVGEVIFRSVHILLPIQSIFTFVSHDTDADAYEWYMEKYVYIQTNILLCKITVTNRKVTTTTVRNKE